MAAIVEIWRKMLCAIGAAAPSARGSDVAIATFMETYGGVYEHSPWVAEAIVAEGLIGRAKDPNELARRMAAVVEAAGRDQQLELLRLHPELAGKLKIGTRLTAASIAEQASARLTECTPEEFARFHELNGLYRSIFGFPFIIAVAGLSRAEILAAFEARIRNDVATEFRTALDQVHKIARLRILAIDRERRAVTLDARRVQDR